MRLQPECFDGSRTRLENTVHLSIGGRKVAIDVGPLDTCGFERLGGFLVPSQIVKGEPLPLPIPIRRSRD
jgi:hypothetical protein